MVTTQLPSFSVSIACASEQGRKSQNQDTVLAECLYFANQIAVQNAGQSVSPSTITKDTPPILPITLAGVADGVSVCHDPKRASVLASQQFVSTLRDKLKQTFAQVEPSPTTLLDDDTVAHALADAMQSANDALYFADLSCDRLSNSQLPALLSTLSGIAIMGNSAHVWHTGDSRVYRYRYSNQQPQGELEQFTIDHRHSKGRDKGALTSAIGAGATVDMHHQLLKLRQNDVFLILTDGVHEFVSTDEMQVMLDGLLESVAYQQLETGLKVRSDKLPKPATAVQRLTPIEQRLNDLPHKLCQASLENGSRDNVSCVAVLVQQASPTIALSKNSTMTSDDSSTNPTLLTGLKIPDAWHVGQVFEGYTVVQILHNTARSQVAVVQDGLGQKRVLKAPSPYFEDDPDFLRQFLKEEKIGRQFHHDSLLTFYARPSNSQHLYHVTEFVDSTSLRTYLDANAPLDFEQVRTLITRIGLALRVMHRNHMLHQDVKPENVLLTASHAVKLIDFGSAGSLILRHALAPPVGDLHYTAPEYYSEAPKGIHSEVFSLGVLTYEMLTGELPFDSKAIMRTGKHGERLEFVSVRDKNPELPYWLNDVLIRAMHPNPRSRTASIGELLSELDPSTHHDREHSKPPLLKRHPVRFWQLVSAVLAMMLIVSWLV